MAPKIKYLFAKPHRPTTVSTWGLKAIPSNHCLTAIRLRTCLAEHHCKRLPGSEPETDLSDLGGQLQILLLFLQKSRHSVDVMVSLGHLAQAVAAGHEVVQGRAGQLRRQLSLKRSRTRLRIEATGRKKQLLEAEPRGTMTKVLTR